MRWCLLALVCAGCADEPITTAWVAPLDGQTGLGTEVPLSVFAPSLALPAGVEPPQDLVVVVDLDGGGRIDGQVAYRRGRIRFVPDAPWPVDTTFAWSVRPWPEGARRPEVQLPRQVTGELRFSTGWGLSLLDVGLATMRDTEETCLILSRRVTPTELDALEVTVDDEPVVPPRTSLVTEAYFASQPRARGDHGVDVVCLGAVVAAPGQSLRAWMGVHGPWRRDVSDHSVTDGLLALRRSTP